MNWLKPLLELFAALGAWLQQRQLINAGRDKQKLKDTLDAIEMEERQDDAEENFPDNADELADWLRREDRKKF